MLKQRVKPIISSSNDKVFKNHSFYQYAVAYLDIDFYFEQGAFEDISTSILSLLDAQFFEMKIGQVIKLIEKAVVCWAISLGKPVKLSKIHNKYFPKNTEVKHKEAIIKGISKGKRSSIAANIFEWTVKTLSEINKSDTNTKSKRKLASRIYEFLPILIRYGSPNNLFESMMKMQLNREFELIGITNDIQEIVEIASFESLEEYQAINMTLLPKDGEILVTHQEMISEEENLEKHSTSWISEVKLFALHHDKAYKIRKLKAHRKKLPNFSIPQFCFLPYLRELRISKHLKQTGKNQKIIQPLSLPLKNSKQKSVNAFIKKAWKNLWISIIC
ncbi:unnamed protein product [Blepharisma stoltei]|uniref:Uncharacterized protein n=1 Tax=Blepharisma stoltei TaxID=1481888 RepID=A0AAU9K831_9CILI|nr:unnamed protein product [Blepharisma stoltei]